jgi:hypothetical protein
MKKTILYISFLFTSSVVFAQTITSLDSAFKSKLLQSSASNFIAQNLSVNYISIDANGNNQI